MKGGTTMAKQRNPWDIHPQKKPQAKLPDSLKAEMEAKATNLIENVLKPKHVLPPPEDGQFNYIIDIGAKWYIRPYVVVRLLAAVYQRVELPDEALDPEPAEVFSSNVARDRKLKVCLVLSPRVSVWYDTEGHEYGRKEATPDLPCEPFVTIGSRRVHFHFDGSGLRPIDGPLS